MYVYTGLFPQTTCGDVIQGPLEVPHVIVKNVGDELSSFSQDIGQYSSFASHQQVLNTAKSTIINTRNNDIDPQSSPTVKFSHAQGNTNIASTSRQILMLSTTRGERLKTSTVSVVKTRTTTREISSSSLIYTSETTQNLVTTSLVKTSTMMSSSISSSKTATKMSASIPSSLMITTSLARKISSVSFSSLPTSNHFKTTVPNPTIVSRSTLLPITNATTGHVTGTTPPTSTPTPHSTVYFLEIFLPPIVGSLLFILCPILFCCVCCRRRSCGNCRRTVRTRRYNNNKYELVHSEEI